MQDYQHINILIKILFHCCLIYQFLSFGNGELLGFPPALIVSCRFPGKEIDILRRISVSALHDLEPHDESVVM